MSCSTDDSRSTHTADSSCFHDTTFELPLGARNTSNLFEFEFRVGKAVQVIGTGRRQSVARARDRQGNTERGRQRQGDRKSGRSGSGRERGWTRRVGRCGPVARAVWRCVAVVLVLIRSAGTFVAPEHFRDEGLLSAGVVQKININNINNIKSSPSLLLSPPFSSTLPPLSLLC